MDPRTQLAIQLMMEEDMGAQDERRRPDGRIRTGLSIADAGGPEMPQARPVEDIARDYAALGAGAVDFMGIPSAVAAGAVDPYMGTTIADDLRAAQAYNPTMAQVGQFVSPGNIALGGVAGAAVGAGSNLARSLLGRRALQAADDFYINAARQFSPARQQVLAEAATPYLDKAKSIFSGPGTSLKTDATAALAGFGGSMAYDWANERLDDDAISRAVGAAGVAAVGSRAAGALTKPRLPTSSNVKNTPENRVMSLQGAKTLEADLGDLKSRAAAAAAAQKNPTPSPLLPNQQSPQQMALPAKEPQTPFSLDSKTRQPDRQPVDSKQTTTSRQKRQRDNQQSASSDKPRKLTPQQEEARWRLVEKLMGL